MSKNSDKTDSNREARIYLIDDDQDIRTMVAMMFKKLGFTNVKTSNTAVGLVEKIQMNLVDLVLLDWWMPEQSGLHILRKIRQVSDVPVIMVTKETSKENVMMAIESQVNGYIVKPFQIRQLEKKVLEVLSEKTSADNRT